MNGTHLPGVQIRFTYLAPDGEELLDGEFDAICVSVPRVGEFVFPNRSAQKYLVVKSVVHSLIKTTADPSQRIAAITVVLREPEPDESP